MSIGELERHRNQCLVELEWERERLRDRSTPADLWDRIQLRIEMLEKEIARSNRQIKSELSALSSYDQNSVLPPDARCNFNGANFNAPVNFGSSPAGNFTGNQNNHRLAASGSSELTNPSTNPQQAIPQCNQSRAYLLFSLLDSSNYIGERFQLRVELQYFCPKAEEIRIEQISLRRIDEGTGDHPSDSSNEAEETYVLEMLPQYLDQAIMTSLGIIQHVNSQRNRQQRIRVIPIINLFLPTALLSKPLGACCNYPEIIQQYPIVVRSADRFHGKTHNAYYCLDNFDVTWEQLFPISASNSTQLSDLKWLKSSDANAADFVTETLQRLRRSPMFWPLAA